MRFPQLLTLAALLAAPAAAVADEDRQQPKHFEKDIVITVSYEYLLYLPPDYDENDEAYPLMLFLHGAGETGSDLEKVKMHGPPKRIEAGEDFPFIVVSPQAPSFGWNPEALDGLIDDVVANERVDESRIYVTGLSMGGGGTLSLAVAHPERFAAIAPICPAFRTRGGRDEAVAALKGLPAWFFHGEKDPTVPVDVSKELVADLEDAGAEVKLTLYPDAGHDSWTVTYENPELYEWLLDHKKGE